MSGRKLCGNKKEKKKYSKIIVALIIFLNTGFAAAVLWAFVTVGSEPVALIGAWFTFTTGELWMLSGIKKREINSGGNDSDQEGGI